MHVTCPAFARLLRKLSQLPGARLYLQSVQDIRIGGRSSNALYQFTVSNEEIEYLNALGGGEIREVSPA